MNPRTMLLKLAAAGLLAAPGTAQAQDRPLSLEARAIAMTPTFGIADDARVGADMGLGFGVGLSYRLSPSLRLMADYDAGFHDTGIGDVNTYHYMGKLGLDVVRTDKVTVTLNAGAGVVSIKPDGASAFNYFAINAGAKIGIALSPGVELLLSPQGDIAFSDDTEVLTKSSWIWPLGLGLRVSF